MMVFLCAMVHRVRVYVCICELLWLGFRFPFVLMTLWLWFRFPFVLYDVMLHYIYIN
jgi:hypothetical protein